MKRLARVRGRKYGLFLVDKAGPGGLDDWEVKIAGFVILLGKDAKRVSDATNRAKHLWKIGLWCQKKYRTPLIQVQKENTR